MERKFRDVETNEVLSLEFLRKEYEVLHAAGESEAESFDEYLDNCMTRNNGTLIEVAEKYGLIVDRLTGETKHKTHTYTDMALIHTILSAAAKRKGLTGDRYKYRVVEVTE